MILSGLLATLLILNIIILYYVSRQNSWLESLTTIHESLSMILRIIDRTYSKIADIDEKQNNREKKSLEATADQIKAIQDHLQLIFQKLDEKKE